MTFAFDEFELDPARRELRIGDAVQSVQPQVFDLLVYLVERRDRVVSKRELLESLWPDSVVTESSLQRAVSLARSALGERGAELIQTFPRQGYRFTGAIERRSKPGEPLTLRPRYAKSEDVHIAYTEFGAGAVDIVIVNGWIMPMRAMFRHSKVRSALEALAKMGRVIMFDKRGTGLSDRVKELPSHQQRMDDLRVVLDACGSEQAILIGCSEGGALAIIYAATYPERVRAMVLPGAFARMTQAPNYAFGYPSDAMEKLRGYISGGWGKGASLKAICPSLASDPEFAEWVAFAEQEGSSPGGAIDLLDMNMRIDLRALLPSIQAPTAVLQATDDRMVDPASGPYLAKHIPRAKYVEIEGDDHIFFFAAQPHLLEGVRWALSQEATPLEEDRFLTTALVVRDAEAIDESAWQRVVGRFKGCTVPGAGSAFFDGPIRALRCGEALATELGAACGVHTGEAVRRGATTEGGAFEVAEEIGGAANPGEVRTSRVVVDLVPGADLHFAPTSTSVLQKGREIEVFSLASES
ncbi:MAG: alpha/beta fold hydrolase [Polyangiales bacterium]